MDRKKEAAVVYTLLHFLVDFSTVFLISKVLLGPSVGIVQRGLVIIAYNIIAFAGQLPIGMLADAVSKNRLFAAAGCMLSCAAYPVAFVSPWTACVLASIGNGAFHIGAGVDILELSMPKAGLSGLFVSSGALGVWLAYKADVETSVVICPIIMLASAVFLVLTYKKYANVKRDFTISYDMPGVTVLLAVTCFMLTIVIRSFMGMVMNFTWKAVPALSFASVIAVVLGKALGGFLGDRFGYVKTAVISLLISALTFIFSFDSWQAGIIAILCFNMTMPLTLTAIADMTNKKYGFAFGLTTFALAIGFIPVVFNSNIFLTQAFFALGAFISLVLMVSGYIFLKKSQER